MNASKALGLAEYVISNMHMTLSRLIKFAKGNRKKKFSLLFLRCVISWFGVVSITMG